MEPALNIGPSIKGAFIKDPRNWMRGAYGEEAYRSALAKLPADEQAMIDGLILPGSWYPIAVWDRFQEAMRGEALAREGQTAAVFNARNMREAGSSIVRGVYKFVLALMSPESAIDKATMLYNRCYNEGSCEIPENGPGRAVARYKGCSPAFRTNLVNNFGPGFVFLLETSGLSNIEARTTRDEVVGGKLTYDVTLTYKRR